MGRASDGRWSDESAGDRRQRADRTARARRSADPIRLGEYPLYPAKFDYALDDRMIDEYRRAVDVLSRELGDEPPQLGHPMPHPKAPALAPDELGTDERGR